MRRLIVGPFLEILIDGDIVGEDDGYARVGCRAVERDALSGFLASQPEVTRTVCRIAGHVLCLFRSQPLKQDRL